MNKLSTFVKGMTKTQKILAATALVTLVALGTVATIYGIKRHKAGKVA